MCITELTAYSFIILVSKGLEIPGFLKARTQGFYNTHMLNIIQFDSNIGVYDEELFYRLSPGEHTYNNIEFDTQVSINSLGIRDDESSLINPEIIFLGDSYTMGWGVEEEQSFVSLIEQKLKKKTLNTAISSYGTAREYTLFKSLNLDSCQLLAIQFCVNDIPENRSFIENNLSLKVSPIDVFQLIQRTNKKNSTYYPFKWSFEIPAKILRAILNRVNKNLSDKKQEQEPEYLNWLIDLSTILKEIQKIYSGKIIIFNLSPLHSQQKVSLQLKDYFRENPSPKIYFLDVNHNLIKDDYFVFDTHIRSTGQEKIANTITNFIKENELLE